MTVVEDKGVLTIEEDEAGSRLTIVARDAAGIEVGRGWLDAAVHERADNFGVAVDVDHRRQGIGRSVFERLLLAASARGVAYLTCPHPEEPGARQLARSVHAICSRRVVDGCSRDVILVPAAPASPAAA